MTAILGRMATYSGQLVELGRGRGVAARPGPRPLTWDTVPKTKPGPDGVLPLRHAGRRQAW